MKRLRAVRLLGVAALLVGATGGLASVGSDEVAAAVVTPTAPHATVPAYRGVIAVESHNLAMYVSTGLTRFMDYGGVLNGPPAVVLGHDRIFYFVRGRNDELYVRSDSTAFTVFRSGIDCATAPGAATDPSDGTYVVGCVLADRTVLLLSGTLPATGNPTPSSTQTFSTTDLNDDSTPVVGGVDASYGAGHLTLEATGPSYPASGAHPAGNVYAFAPGISDAAELGGTWDYADSRVEGKTYDEVAYRKIGSSSVTVQRSLDGHQDYIALGGSIIGSPAAVEDAAGTGITVHVTGTNHQLYQATLNDNGSRTSFVRYPAAADIVGGPGAAATNLNIPNS